MDASRLVAEQNQFLLSAKGNLRVMDYLPLRAVPKLPLLLSH
jgi:hypothetical protein